jgi:hypothetical protein
MQRIEIILKVNVRWKIVERTREWESRVRGEREKEL